MTRELPGGRYLHDRPLLRGWTNTYILGKSRSGKTNFMTYLACHQMKDMAVIILDPYGELARMVATMADKDRLVYADILNPLTINCLQRPYLNKSERARELADAINASVAVNSPGQMDITVKMFRIISQAIGIIRNGDIDLEVLSEFLDSKSFRAKYFRDKGIVIPTYWKEFDSGGIRYEQLRASAERVADRFFTIYSNENLVDFVLGDDDFDLFKIINNKNIVVFNLEGMQADEVFYIGNLITHAIKTFLVKSPKNTNGVGIYIDEFHLFLTKQFQNEFTKCLKKNINFVVCHHDHAQTDKSLLNIVLGSSYLKTCFKCGKEDAKRMASEIDVDFDDICGIKKYHAFINLDDNIHYIKTFKCDIEEYQPEQERVQESVNFFRNGIISIRSAA